MIKLLKITLAVLLVLFLFSSLKPALVSFVQGDARSLGLPLNDYEIVINDQQETKALLFQVDENFAGNNQEDYFVLYLPNKKESTTRNVLIIDKKNKKIKIPNSNEQNYDLVLDRLIQNKSGETMFSIQDDMKGLNFNPQLKINSEKISFKMPDWSEYQVKTIQLKKIN